MNETNKTIPVVTDAPACVRKVEPGVSAISNRDQPFSRKELRRWWIKLFLQPLLFLACGLTLIATLGIAQRLGFISAGSGNHGSGGAASEAARYICPMMCTPPQAQPGRCPVCAMELVPAMASGGAHDSRSIQVDSAARRVANIRTVSVNCMPMTNSIRAIGELNYDESALKTISAYVDGRLDRLYADYTGFVVKKGEHLALIYSPLLYSAQGELLLAKKAHDKRAANSSVATVFPGPDVYESAKQRLVLLGMTESQIEKLEQDGKANSRMHVFAPIGGTVIEKIAVEGQYVKEGDAIYKLADLSKVWLKLRLFPEDAALIRYGQKISAQVQSLPGRTFSGRVAFIDPIVETKTRTVGVRIEMPNQDGLLRVGDYVKAIIDVTLPGTESRTVYDPELANKWISPRHPHVIAECGGICPDCGVNLVPASQFGFSDQPVTSDECLVLPRDAVLMAGDNSVVYVESEPGRFEIRHVVLGPICGDRIVIRSGVKKGEIVAERGNFLIDSQMQLAGNPSLIDPTRAEKLYELPLLDLPPIDVPQLIEAETPVSTIKDPEDAVETTEEPKLRIRVAELPTEEPR